MLEQRARASMHFLREPHACLVDHGHRVVAYDQLGCGESNKPADPSLWTIERYAEEIETVDRELRVEQTIRRSASSRE